MTNMVKKEFKMEDLRVERVASVTYFKCLEEEEEGSNLVQERESLDLSNLKLLFLKSTTVSWKMLKLPEQETASSAMEREERPFKNVVNAKEEE